MGDISLNVDAGGCHAMPGTGPGTEEKHRLKIPNSQGESV